MSPSSLTTRLIKVHVLTASHRILGSVKVTNTGVCGILNDPTHGSIVMMDAVMGRTSDPDTVVANYEAVRINKVHIYNACLERREDVGPRTVRAGYEQTNEYDVKITDGSYEYEGVFEWSGRFDFSSMMSGGTGEFFAVTDALVRSVDNQAFELKSPAVVINRQRLTTFSHAMRKAPAVSPK